VLGLALWVIYDAVAGSDHAAITFTPVGHSIYLGVTQLGEVLRDGVGHFGAQTIPMPTWSRWVWWLAIVAMIAAALAYGGIRERIVALATLVVALMFAVLSYAWVYRSTGFQLQGREVLGVLTLIPLICGEIVWRGRRSHKAPAGAQARLTARVPQLALLGFAAFQAYAWWVNAHVSAWAQPGITPPAGVLSFVHDAHWAPPLGWSLWTVAAGVGVLLLGLAAVTARARAAPAPIAVPVPA
jgi:hypothetical protein